MVGWGGGVVGEGQAVEWKKDVDLGTLFINLYIISFVSTYKFCTPHVGSQLDCCGRPSTWGNPPC